MPSQIIQWCDPCYAEDVKTEGEPVAISFGINSPTVTILLCAQHVEELIKPVAELVSEYGEPVDATPTPRGSAGGRITVGQSGRRDPAFLTKTRTRQGRQPVGGRANDCLWCELSYAGGSTSGFARHLRVAHGFANLTEAFGGPCPICGEGPYELMSAHVKRKHSEFGFEAVAQPFIWARDNGDPHGVYAAKLQQKPSLDPEEAWEQARATERVQNKEPGTKLHGAARTG